MANITASLAINAFSADFAAVQPSSPVQLFTPATGQRAFTFADAIGSLNEQINANTDPTSLGADSPDLLYGFETGSNSMIMVDAVSTSKIATVSTWDCGYTYIKGTWQ